MKTIRIFISSPGDVAEERERAREVVESLRRRYAGRLWLKPVLWEDLPLQADASFQEGIDVVLDLEGGVDVGVFILWSRMGELQSGGKHRSGTEREFELLREARQRSGGRRPVLLVYARADDAGFAERLRGRNTAEQRDLLEQKAMVERFIEETFQDAETGRNLRAFHRFDRPQTFSQRLRAHLSELLDELAGDASGAGVVWDVESQGCPFMGLEAFGAEQAEVFFGREHEVLEGRRMLKEHACDGCAFLLVTGASGSGKSSLARAGLLPEVAAHEVDETVVQWRTLVVMPGELGEDAVAGLVARMGSADVLPELCAEGVDVGEVVAGLKRDAVTTVNLSVKRAAAEAGLTAGGGVRVLLLVDQLEEAFGWRRELRETFFGVLEAMARSGVVWVVATVRGDFLGEVHESEAIGRLLAARPVLTVTSPGADALRRMIEEPARLAGLRFEERDGRNLGERILADAARHDDLLPLVEFVLLRLYEQRDKKGNLLTFAIYRAMGGVEGALSRHAEEVFAGRGSEERDALATVLKRLVTLGEVRGGSSDGAERVLRQRVALADFGGKETAVRRLVEALVAARLLTAGGGSGVAEENGAGTGTVTVVHEALLRVWPRAAAWVEGNRELLRVRARVAGRIEEQRTGVISEGDPLLEAAKVHLAADSEAFSDEQRAFIERSVTAVDDRRRKRERTRRAVMAGMSALTLAALAAAGFAWNKQQEAETERERAVAAEHETETQLAETRKQFERSQLEEGRAWLERAKSAYSNRQPVEALFYAGRSVGFHGYGRLSDTVDDVGSGRFDSLLGISFTDPGMEKQRAREAHEVQALIQRIRPTCLPLWSSPSNAHEGSIAGLAFSPNGARFASWSHSDKTARIWKTASGTVVAPLEGRSDGIISLAFNSDGTRLVGMASHGHYMVWDAYGGKKLVDQDAETEGVVHHAFDPDCARLARWLPNQNTIRIQDVLSGEEIFAIKGLTCKIRSLIFSPNGRLLTSISNDSVMRIWNSRSGARVATLNVVTGEPLSEKSDLLSFASETDEAAEKDKNLEKGKNESIPKSQALSNDMQQEMKRPSAPTGLEIVGSSDVTINGDKADGLALAIDSTGKFLAASSAETARIWSMSSWKTHATLKNRYSRFLEMEFSPDGSRLMTCDSFGDIKLWNTTTGAVILTLTRLGNGGSLAQDSPYISQKKKWAFNPNGKSLAVVGTIETSDGPKDSVQIWDVQSGNRLATIPNRRGRISAVTFSPDGTRLSSLHDKGSIVLWDTSINGVHSSLEGKLRAENHTSPTGYIKTDSGSEAVEYVNALELGRFASSPDGRRVAAAVGDETVAVWDVVSGAKIASLRSDSTPVLGVAISPNGLLLSSRSRKLVTVWNLASGKRISAIEVDSNFITDLAFSPDGERLAGGLWEGTAKIWNVLDGQEVFTFTDHSTPVTCVAFDPTGNRLASRSLDRGFKLWDARNGKMLATIETNLDDKIRSYLAFEPLFDGNSELLIKSSLWAAALYNNMAYSPDGACLVGGFSGDNLGVWNASDGKFLNTLASHSGRVFDLVFSPDGRYLAAAATGPTLKVWDVKTGVNIATCENQSSIVGSLTLDHNELRFASQSGDGTIDLWSLPVGKDQPVNAGFAIPPTSVIPAPANPDQFLENVGGSPDLLSYFREGWFSFDDRNCVPADKFSPIANVRTLQSRDAELSSLMRLGTTPAESYSLSLRAAARLRLWRALSAHWAEARQAGLAADQMVRREFVIHAAVAARRLAETEEPEFPIDLWNPLLDACQAVDWDEPRFTLPMAQALRALSDSSEPSTDLAKRATNVLFKIAPASWIEDVQASETAPESSASDN